MKNKFKTAAKGAIIGGIIFGGWVALLFFTTDSTNGSVISFGVFIPSLILGFPWGIVWTDFAMDLQKEYGVNSTYINVIVFSGYVLSVMLNCALVGLIVGKKDKASKHPD